MRKLRGDTIPVPARDEQVVKALVPEESPREEGAGGHRRVQRGVPVGHRIAIILGFHWKFKKISFVKIAICNSKNDPADFARTSGVKKLNEKIKKRNLADFACISGVKLWNERMKISPFGWTQKKGFKCNPSLKIDQAEWWMRSSWVVRASDCRCQSVQKTWRNSNYNLKIKIHSSSTEYG
jgi:hypothetical protein